MENSNLLIFENPEFGQVRTTLVDNEPWFVAADVCKALEIGNPRQAVSRLDDDEKLNTVINSDGIRGNPNMTIVSEPGLYSLILRSRKPEAKVFKRWITHEVIPSIRKHGAYVSDSVLDQLEEHPELIADKQFITVESKNGNYFYIIIDRSGDTENVYFLNLVDEADLLALMENGEKDTSAPTCTCKDHCEPGEVNTDCPVCKTNMSECMGKQAVKTDAEKDKQTDVDKDTDTQSEPAEKKSSSGLLALVLILILAGGALYWFKFRKKKPDTKGSSDLDDYDFGEEDEDDAEYEVEPDEAESSDQE